MQNEVHAPAASTGPNVPLMKVVASSFDVSVQSTEITRLSQTTSLVGGCSVQTTALSTHAVDLHSTGHVCEIVGTVLHK